MIYDKEEFAREFFKQNSEIALQCKTKEDALDFCAFMTEHNRVWRNGQPYDNNTEWDNYRGNTVYYPGGTYSEVNYAIESGTKVLVAGKDVIFDYYKDFDSNDIEEYLNEFAIKG